MYSLDSGIKIGRRDVMDKVRRRKNWTLKEEIEQSAEQLQSLLSELGNKNKIKDKKHQENKFILINLRKESYKKDALFSTSLISKIISSEALERTEIYIPKDSVEFTSIKQQSILSIIERLNKRIASQV